MKEVLLQGIYYITNTYTNFSDDRNTGRYPTDNKGQPDFNGKPQIINFVIYWFINAHGLHL